MAACVSSGVFAINTSQEAAAAYDVVNLYVVAFKFIEVWIRCDLQNLQVWLFRIAIEVIENKFDATVQLIIIR